MGFVTPNMGIFIPAAGETNYDASFAAGMINIDQHDHSGGPNKGVPIAASGLADGSVTYPKLNINVVDDTTGIGTSLTMPNQLVILGILQSIYKISTTNGYIVKNGPAAAARTLTGTSNQITVTNGDGTVGNPVFSFPSTFFTASTFTPTITTSNADLVNLAYSSQDGSYQRIGNWIMFDFEIVWTADSGSGTFILQGLPVAAVGNYWIAGFLTCATITPKQQVVNYNVSSSTNLTIFPITDSGTGVELPVPGGALSFNMQMTGIYRIA